MFDNASSPMTILLIVLAILLAALAGYLLGRASTSKSSVGQDADAGDELAQRFELQQQELQKANARVVEFSTRAEGLQQQLEYVKAQLTQSQRAEQNRLEHDQERTRQEAEQREQRQRAALQEQSKVLSALSPVQKNLEALQQKVAQIEEGRKHEMGMLGEQLKGLGEQQTRLDKETSSLASALRDNKIRGAWGEAQLKNIVESAGLLEHVDFDTQVVVTDAQGHIQRPDMIVHLPGGKTIPIDAKAPYANYQRACDIPDTAPQDELARRSALLKAHAKDLREHVKTLGDKAYWNAFETAPDFVVAFIPNESLLQAALNADPTLMDDAFAQKVALTSPVTLWAVLKSVAYAWQQQSLTDDAKTLFTLSRELYERFVVLGGRANALGKAITKTVGAYNQFASSLESRVLVTARKLQKLDQSKIIDEVDLIDSEQANIREFTAPEVQEGNPEEDSNPTQS
ncbi:MAG: DNA recombination protein RmuC [Bifidobacterium psychraerophilum]|uniref:DNA recombination protein RmuC n=1 Tax=Bifidobacterium psychraerophilum TaxID=218140 RepID=UPI0039ED8D7A